MNLDGFPTRAAGFRITLVSQQIKAGALQRDSGMGLGWAWGRRGGSWGWWEGPRTWS